MKRKICIILYFIGSLLSLQIFAQYPQMDFPLQIGNRWQYSDGGFNLDGESRAIKDTIMPNGLTYTQITGLLINGLYRKEGQKVFCYNTSINTEYLKYDFSLKKGDTVSIQSYVIGKILTKVYSGGTINILGYTKNYMAFYEDDINSTNDHLEEVADGLGIILNFGEGPKLVLKGAIINGIQYGEILKVEKPNKHIPINFHLYQNYPNPFNPTTIIKYDIPLYSHVKIIVYNSLGEIIRILLNKYQSPGTYKLNFNASGLSSGVYYYQMLTEGKVLTKKLILIK